MKIIEAVQGTPEWLAARTNRFTASEAPAMLGLSKYRTRQALLREKATGVTEDVDEAKQRLFDRGHDSEAAARPLAETILGEDLFPATGVADIDGLPLLASFDGLTMDELTVWENKLHRDDLLPMMEAEDLSGEYWPQVEQQLLVSGGDTALFTLCNGESITAHFFYESKPERRAQLIAGWKQFADDLANYQHIEPAAKLTAAHVESLPTLDIQLSGGIIASNFDTWRAIVAKRIDGINTNLQTDQDFADADAMVKFLGEGEKRIDLVKSQAQSQAADIDAVFRELDDIKKLMASKRLELDKLVKSRKEAIKAEIVMEGRAKLQEHIASLNTRIGKSWMPNIPADFAGAIKNKRTVQSLRDSVDGELTRAKLAANEMADRIQINLAEYGRLAVGNEALFADLPNLVNQTAEAFSAMIENRITKHKQAEAERLEREREKIRAEEEAKAAAKIKAEQEEAERQRKASTQPDTVASQTQQTKPAAQSTEVMQTITPAAVAPATPIDNGRYLRLGEISQLLEFTVTAEFLAKLGFNAVQEKNARLYRECDFPAICRAIVEHVAFVASLPPGMRKAA